MAQGVLCPSCSPVTPLFPGVLQVYGTVFHMNQGNPFNLKALVDKWPDFSTVLVRPQEQDMTDDRDHYTNTYQIFSRDTRKSREALASPEVINWKQHLQIQSQQHARTAQAPALPWATSPCPPLSPWATSPPSACWQVLTQAQLSWARSREKCLLRSHRIGSIREPRVVLGGEGGGHAPQSRQGQCARPQMGPGLAPGVAWQPGPRAALVRAQSCGHQQSGPLSPPTGEPVHTASGPVGSCEQPNTGPRAALLPVSRG
ncbi:Glycine N-phenylacetyltransferase, partial [Galemys pyrenaicus]